MFAQVLEPCSAAPASMQCPSAPRLRHLSSEPEIEDETPFMLPASALDFELLEFEAFSLDAPMVDEAEVTRADLPLTPRLAPASEPQMPLLMQDELLDFALPPCALELSDDEEEPCVFELDVVESSKNQRRISRSSSESSDFLTLLSVKDLCVFDAGLTSSIAHKTGNRGKTFSTCSTSYGSPVLSTRL